jgi:macrolide transport system ATP-binding/permease protein
LTGLGLAHVDRARPFESFSGGERAIAALARLLLQIARLIAEQANLLILDEPTNHASFDVVEGLEAALAGFQGPVIAATHDRRFMRQLACGSRPAEI